MNKLEKNMVVQQARTSVRIACTTLRQAGTGV
ncbi:MAG: hypothetical protein RI955_1680 [Bacteroidota bacterium]